LPTTVYFVTDSEVGCRPENVRGVKGERIRRKRRGINKEKQIVYAVILYWKVKVRSEGAGIYVLVGKPYYPPPLPHSQYIIFPSLA
jgi:hypothetical protein